MMAIGIGLMRCEVLGGARRLCLSTAQCFALLWLCPGCGSDSSGSDALEADPCAANGATDPTTLIDDFEDMDPNLPMVGGRSGSWWYAGDFTPGAVFEPQEIIPVLLPEARCDSRFALRVSGSGYDDWGALVGMSFAYAPDDEGVWGAVPHSASGHTGVRFWAKIGDTASQSVRFSLSGRETDPAPDAPCAEPEPRGDGCLTSLGVPLSGISTTWTYYEVPFSGLATHPVSDKQLDLTGLYSLIFNFAAAEVFDFWLDDVEFY